MRAWGCTVLVLVLVNCMCIIWAEARQWREELGDSTSRLSIRDGYTGRHLNAENSPAAKLKAILKRTKKSPVKSSSKTKPTSCKKQTIDPQIPLTISQADFIFELIKIKVPKSCGSLEFSSFQKCSKDIGVTKGCCKPGCTAFLKKINGECWEDFQTELCMEEYSQVASMMDVLMRRCDADEREMQCLRTTPCDERLLKPKGKITMNTASFAFSLGKIENPSSCENFEISDLLECSEMIGVDKGCCNKSCSAVFTKISDACWKDVGKVLCADKSDQPSIIVDLMSRHCDKKTREIPCDEEATYSCKSCLYCEPYAPRSSALSKKPLSDLDKQLLEAAGEGNLKKVEALIVAGANVNGKDESKNTPMDWAAFGGHTAVIDALLTAGGNMDSKDNDGRTPIMEAAWGGHVEAMDALVDGGSYLELTSRDGSTALIYAAGEGYVEAVRFLINEGSEMDVENDSGATALMVAAHNGHTEVVEALIDAGADTDIQDKRWGQTAMMWAAERGHIDVVRALITGGSPKGTNSKDGSTAESLAAEHGHSDIVALLKTPCKAEGRVAAHLCAREGR